jgi:hypothetical protein
LNGKTPFEVLFGRVPNIEGIRVFGCLAYASVRVGTGKKLDPRIKPMMNVGGPQGQTYRLFDPETIQVHRVRHVRFDETSFPGFSMKGQHADKTQAVLLDDYTQHDNASAGSNSSIDEDSGFISALEKLYAHDQDDVPEPIDEARELFTDEVQGEADSQFA